MFLMAIELLPKALYPNEPPSVCYKGDLVQASRFTKSAFLAACRDAGFNDGQIAENNRVLCDLEELFIDVSPRKTGEPIIYHAMGTALIDLLECGNRDSDLTMAELGHDGTEELELLQGSEYNSKKIHKTLKILQSHFNARAAKIIESVTYSPEQHKIETSTFFPAQDIPLDVLQILFNKSEKPLEIDEMIKRYHYFYHKFVRVLALHPEERVAAARAKTCDRIFNLRTEAEKNLLRKFLQTRHFLLPIAAVAGNRYLELLVWELQNVYALLSDEEKAIADTGFAVADYGELAAGAIVSLNN